jgi:hypothetical protein
MTDLTTRVDFTGPFFTHSPGATLRGNIKAMMTALSKEMEADVRGQIDAKAGAMEFYTGWTRSHVIGRAESLSHKPWLATAVVSANTNGMSAKDAIRTKAAAASIERRFHPFRRTASAVRGSRALLADLARGLE